MTTPERSELQQFLRERRDELVDCWYRAIAHTSYTDLTLAEVRSHLYKFTDQIVLSLISEPLDNHRAREVGSRLASMHYLTPHTICSTQRILAHELVRGLQVDQVAELHPKLSTLLAEVAAGYFERARDMILLEQEQIKAALINQREEVEEALRQSEHSLAEAQRVAHLGHWDYDLLQDELRWSNEIYSILGVSKHSFGGKAEDYFRLVPPDDAGIILKGTQEALTGRTISSEHRIVRPDGETRIVQQRLQFTFDYSPQAVEEYLSILSADEDGKDEHTFFEMLRAASKRLGEQLPGKPIRAIGTMQDITERKRTEEALLEAEERFRNAFEHAPIGMALLSLDRHYLQVNHALCEMLGYSEEELLGMTSSEITHPEDLEISRSFVERILKGTVPKYNLEKRYVNAEGDAVWVLLNVSLVRDAEGNASHFIAQYQNITERKSLEKQLEYQAFHDPLTDLPNRALFLDRLNQALMQKNGRGGGVQVLFLDLDNFKLINDSLGHSAGDKLLVEAAERLRTCVRSQDTVARFGGDEFTIMIENATGNADNAVLVAKRITETLKAPFRVMGQEVFLTASIGIVSSTSEEDLGENLLRDADTAMYRAKEAGKAGYEIFDPNMNVRALEQLKLASELRRAIEREEFVLCYQPKVELTSGRVVGMEALVRWDHPERGLVYPDEFISLAEETGIMVALGKRVAEYTCRQTRLWQEQHLNKLPFVVGINLSVSQLQHPMLVQELAQTLKESGADLKALELEITENMLMRDADGLFAALTELKSLGVRLAIDDFGTGYSSLSHLNRLPVDTLKIDKSFVERLGEEPRSKLITSATISLAKTLGLEVVAEGIETAEQLAQLKELGCSFGQGYYLAEPLTSAEASALIAEGSLLSLS